jgi:hypothetical protein
MDRSIVRLIILFTAVFLMAAQPVILNWAGTTYSVHPAIEQATKIVLAARWEELPSLDYSYAISDVFLFDQPGGRYYVSVLALDIQPGQTWRLDDAVWLATLLLYPDPAIPGGYAGIILQPGATGEYIDPASGKYVDGSKSVEVQTNPDAWQPQLDDGEQTINSPTWGEKFRWPMEEGKDFIFGVLGVHEAGFDAVHRGNMMAIDFVSGAGLAANSAGSAIYAMGDGSVDYVCRDGTSVAVRMSSGILSSAPDLIYAHLLDNPGLYVGRKFAKGELIGALRAGDFDDTCGYADQDPANYHLHLGVELTSFEFFIGEGVVHYLQIEDCRLWIERNYFDCSGKRIGPGQWFSGGDGGETNGTRPWSPKNFWDWIVYGIESLFNEVIAILLPAGPSRLMASSLYDTATLYLQITYTLAMTNFDMTLPLMLFAGFVTLEISRILLATWRLFKKLFPGSA